MVAGGTIVYQLASEVSHPIRGVALARVAIARVDMLFRTFFQVLHVWLLLAVVAFRLPRRRDPE